MATSETIALTTTRDEIITEALEQLGVIEAGNAPNSNDITTCARSLNFIVKAWQTDGLEVYTVKEGFLFLERGKNDYVLSSTGDRWTYSYIADSITADALAAFNQVEVSDYTDYTVGDTVGLAVDDGTVFWTSLALKLAPNILVFVDDLPAAATSGNALRSYTSKADRPLRVIEASVQNESGTSRPIDLISRKEWDDLSNKTYQGSVTEAYFDYRVTPPVLHVWPQTAQNFDIMPLYVTRITETFVNATDNPDFPQEWFYPLSTNLAMTVGPKFGVPATNQNFKEVKEQAIIWYERAKNFNSGPESSVTMTVDMGPYS